LLTHVQNNAQGHIAAVRSELERLRAAEISLADSFVASRLTAFASQRSLRLPDGCADP